MGLGWRGVTLAGQVRIKLHHVKKDAALGRRGWVGDCLGACYSVVALVTRKVGPYHTATQPMQFLKPQYACNYTLASFVIGTSTLSWMHLNIYSRLVVWREVFK